MHNNWSYMYTYVHASSYAHAARNCRERTRHGDGQDPLFGQREASLKRQSKQTAAVEVCGSPSGTDGSGCSSQASSVEYPSQSP